MQKKVRAMQKRVRTMLVALFMTMLLCVPAAWGSGGKPINILVMGRPALGMPGDVYPYHDDVDAVVATLADDAAMARKAEAMLVYMGHGNEYWSTGIYVETQKKMRIAYPEVATFIGVVEGAPALHDFLSHLQNSETKKIILKPFMIVAGDHATNDMAGPEEDSWKSILAKEGFEVQPVLTGLGSNNDFAKIFVAHIADTARQSGIELKYYLVSGYRATPGILFSSRSS